MNRSLLGVSSVVLVSAAIVYTINAINKKSNTEIQTRLTTSKQIDNVLYFSTLALWPFVFYLICDFNELNLKSNPYISLGLVWPVVLLLMRMVHIAHDQKEDNQECHVRHGDIRGSAGLLFTAAFGVGVILTTLNRGSDPVGSKMVLLSLLFCVAFLIPTSSYPVDSHISHGIRTFQSCVTQIAIGIFITGISVSYFQK